MNFLDLVGIFLLFVSAYILASGLGLLICDSELNTALSKDWQVKVGAVSFAVGSLLCLFKDLS